MKSISWHFVWAQIIGWGLYFFFLILSSLAFIPNPSMSVWIIQGMVFIALTISTIILRSLIRTPSFQNLSNPKIAVRLTLFVLEASVLSQTIIHFMIYFVLPQEGVLPFNWGQSLIYVFNVALVLSIWVLLYQSWLSWKKRRNDELTEWRLKNELQQAELQILKAHVNSHFLFNALNNIRSLVIEDPEKARDMITNLSGLLRYTLTHANKSAVTIKEELDITEQYLALQSMQYEERLTWSTLCSESLFEVQIPPMTIQLLVENAIKHGISVNKSKGIIDITLHGIRQDFVIDVLNSGDIISKPNYGTGLHSLLHQLESDSSYITKFELKKFDDYRVSATLHFKSKEVA